MYTSEHALKESEGHSFILLFSALTSIHVNI